ncbi:MAG: amino acid permease [Caulobacter sp.]
MGPVLATLLVAGNMIGSGLYLLPVSLAPFGGSSLLAWVVAGAGALAIAGVYALLGRLVPEADGVIDYPRRALHPAAGFVAWAAYWVSCWGGNAAIALAAIGYLAALFPVLGGQVATFAALLALLWIFTLVNLTGARGVARLGGASLVVGLIPVVAAIVLGLAAFDADLFAKGWNPSARPLSDTVPAAVVLVFWAFLGMESANAAASKVRDPARTLPIAAIGGVLIAIVVYILASVAVLGVMSPEELGRSTAPFADVVSRLAGPIAGAVVAACAAIKALGTLAGWIFVSAETGRAGATAGYLPRLFSETDPAVVPRRGILVTGVLMTATAFATMAPAISQQFNLVIGFSVAAFMLVYALGAAALIREAAALSTPARRLGARALALAALAFSVWIILVWASGL